MKIKAYSNDEMQKIISQENPQLNNPERDKFIIGATTIPMDPDIKQEFIQNYQKVYEQAQQINEKKALSINVIYNYQKWNKLIAGYNKEDLIIQTAKLYEEGTDLNNSHFKKSANLLHRYLRKICRNALTEKMNIQIMENIEPLEQYKQNNEATINLIKKWVAQNQMSTDIIIYQDNENQYIISMINEE